MFLGNGILREMAEQRVMFCKFIDAVKNSHHFVKCLQSGLRNQNGLTELPDNVQLPLQSHEDVESIEKRLTDKQIKQNTFTLPSPYNSSILEKITKLLTQHPMTVVGNLLHLDGRI